MLRKSRAPNTEEAVKKQGHGLRSTTIRNLKKNSGMSVGVLRVTASLKTRLLTSCGNPPFCFLGIGPTRLDFCWPIPRFGPLVCTVHANSPGDLSLCQYTLRDKSLRLVPYCVPSLSMAYGVRVVKGVGWGSNQSGEGMEITW